jgi:uncharacterized membrane protein YkgB
MNTQTMKTSEVLPGTAMGMHRGAIAELGRWATHYALVVVFLWFGALKFTAYEASGIAPLVMNSPLVGWWHAVLGIGGTAKMLGIYEILTGLLLASRPFAPRLAAIGGAMGVVCFAVTISFMFTTPGVLEPSEGPLALSAMPGQFLLKDIVLFAVSLWVMGASLTEASDRR